MNDAVKFIQEAIGLSPGVTEAALSDLVQGSPFSLPDEYVNFLRASNGAEGCLEPNGYLALWPAEEVLPLNEGYKVSEFAPGLLLIGGNGGNAAYGIDGRNSTDFQPVYVETDYICMGWDDIFFTAHSLVDLFKHIAQG